jgi:hypothetical protein
MSERKELLRFTHTALAVSISILAVGVFFLRDADEAILQAFALVVFFLNFVIFLGLEKRALRHKKRDQ